MPKTGAAVAELQTAPASTAASGYKMEGPVIFNADGATEPTGVFDDVQVAWGGELGAALQSALTKTATSELAYQGEARPAATDAGVPNTLPATAEAPAMSAANPAASKGSESAEGSKPESESGHSWDSLTDDDIKSWLDTPQARRNLGPRFQSEKDKGYQRGYEYGISAKEQEFTLAVAAGQINASPEARTQAKQILEQTRNNTANGLLTNVSDSFASLAESYGADPSIAKIEAGKHASLNDYVTSVVKGIIDSVSTAQTQKAVKPLVDAELAKRNDNRLRQMPGTTDFVPSQGNAGSGIHSIMDADKAFASGQMSLKDYMSARQKYDIK